MMAKMLRERRSRIRSFAAHLHKYLDYPHEYRRDDPELPHMPAETSLHEAVDELARLARRK